MVWVTFRIEVARWNHLGMDSAATVCRIGRECLRLFLGIQLTSRASAFTTMAHNQPVSPDEPEALAMASIPNHNDPDTDVFDPRLPSSFFNDTRVSGVFRPLT